MDRRIIPIDMEVYEKCGFCAALVYWYIGKWCASNERHGKHLHDGRCWMFDTEKAIADGIGAKGASSRSISRALDALLANGFIVRGNYNAARRNRTWWYSVPNLQFANLTFCQLDKMPTWQVAPCQVGEIKRQCIDLTTDDDVAVIAHAPAHEEAVPSASSPEIDWRADLADCLARTERRAAERYAILDELEKAARMESDPDRRDSMLDYVAAEREDVPNRVRLSNAIDRVSCGLGDPAVDPIELYDGSLYDEDGNRWCWGELVDDIYGIYDGLFYEAYESYVRKAWADGIEPSAAHFASREAQQSLCDRYAARLDYLRRYYEAYEYDPNPCGDPDFIRDWED